MEKLFDFYNNYKSKIVSSFGFVIIILVFLLGFSLIFSKDSDEESIINDNDIVKEEKNINEVKSETKDKIFVDVKGMVLNENVYEIEYGKRVIDAINMAGGLLENANTRFINLSRVLEDGDVIVIYSNEEIIEAKQNNIIYVDTPCECTKVNNDACLENSVSVGDELININTASKEELMLLDGIGEAKSKSIIDYREKNGSFASIEEIKDVSGISDSIYEKIKDRIKV